MKRRTWELTPESSPQALEAALAERLEVSQEEAARRIRAGSVYVQGKRVLVPAAQVVAGQKLTVVLEEGGEATDGALATDSVSLVPLYEDLDVVAFDKPAGLPAQPTQGRVGNSLVDAASAHLGRAAGLVHRLDRETSGVTVFGKLPHATSGLAEAFREGLALKRYLAVVGPGLDARGEVDLPLSKDPSRPGRYRATRQANGVPAFTAYERLSESDGFSLVALYPRTGRTHQLRAHLTALGFPILGDKRYGGEAQAGALLARRCLLHAERLVIPHPRTSKSLELHAPLPADIQAFFTAAGRAWP